MKKLIFTLTMLMAFGMSFGQIKVVAPDGDVGIGVSTPGAKLEVGGNMKLSNPNGTVQPSGTYNINAITGHSDSHRLLVSNNTTTANSRGFFEMFGSEAGLSTANRAGEFIMGGTYFRFFANNSNAGFGSEAMRITAGKDVGIGVSGPSEKLHVAGNIFFAGAVNGSDRKLKKDIKAFDQGLETILEMKPVTYKYNGRANIDSDRTHYGVIAQEVQKIAPFMVSEFEYEERDINNNVTLQETYLAIDPAVTTYLLVNSVQEQQEIIEVQDSKIEQLEDRIAELESLVSKIVNQQTINLQDGIIESSGKLNQNQPNPFNEETLISYEIPENANSSLINVYNMSGQLIKSLILESGLGNVKVKALGLANGTYTYSLVIDGKIIDSKKMILSK